ncbi:MAG: 5'-nucleotidase C-terminal domain-containing protein [Kofleriaceae bacterium]
MARLVAVAVAAVAVAASGCGASTEPPPHRPPPTAAPGARTITIVGTNDLHGAIDRLPILAGYLDILRAARAADGGALVPIDAGDMFQGTLASNLDEGKTVVAAYGAMGYAAAAIGNHEFDFGPVGPAVTAATPAEDPRGALLARAAEASFPLLTANILDAESGERIVWPRMPPSTVIDAAGVSVGIIGVTTEATPFTTMPANFVGLTMLEPALAVVAEARRLRAAGAALIVVAAHVGSKCSDLHDPSDLSSCDQDEELFTMAAAIPPGTVDVIVAGHTHAAMAHRIHDIAVIESYASGRAFGRVDVRVSARGVVTAVNISQPRDLCPLGDDGAPVPVAACGGQTYEGQPVVANAAVQALVDETLAAAKARADERLGPTVTAPITRAYGEESALGNLFTDLMLAAQPSADVALTNGGGLRADIPAGPLTYDGLYQANPFDNRFALVALRGRHLRRLVSNNLGRDGGIFSLAGVTVAARCEGARLVVDLTRKGKLVGDDDALTLVTSDFLASGGDGVIGRLKLPDGAVTVTDEIIRESMATQLRGVKQLDPAVLLDRKAPRLRYPGARPVRCGDAGPSTPAEPD